jgi:hypothetical protein
MDSVDVKHSGTVIIGSYHDFDLPPATESFNKVDHNTVFPEDVTLGFRGIFWNVFSDIAKVSDTPYEFQWLGEGWRLEAAFVARSFKQDMQLYLEEKYHIFILLHVISMSGKDSIWINQRAFSSKLNEQDLLASLYRAVSGMPGVPDFKRAKHSRNLPARFLIPVGSLNVDTSTAALLSFYSFAQLIVWQIGRDHAAIELKPDPLDINTKLASVLRNRARIINIGRFFLTKNITNNPVRSVIVGNARKHFRIKEKFEGFVETNDLIERFFLTSNQIRQNKTAKVLNVTALFLAIVGLPTAIMSMLIALQDNTMIVKQPKTIIDQSEYISFLGVSLGVSVAAIMVIWLFVRAVINRQR